MVELKKKDIESANKRSLRRYIRNAYKASTDNEEEGTGLKKAYVIQLLIGINVKMKMQTKNEGSTAKTNVGDANE